MFEPCGSDLLQFISDSHRMQSYSSSAVLNDGLLCVTGSDAVIQQTYCD